MAEMEDNIRSGLVPISWKHSRTYNEIDKTDVNLEFLDSCQVPFTNHDDAATCDEEMLQNGDTFIFNGLCKTAEQTCQNGVVTTHHRPTTPVQTGSSTTHGAASPITPTANLKMLMSAISPELRNRDRRKKLDVDATNECSVDDELFKEVEKGQRLFSSGDISDENGEGPAVTTAPPRSTKYKKCSKNLALNDPDVASSSQEVDCSGRVSRKEKSLGLLCHKFISKYPLYPDTNDTIYVCLDVVTKDLGVERRRIYDIVNVLESLEIMGRVAKNKYVWHGKNQLVTTLTRLKVLGESQGFTEQTCDLAQSEIPRSVYSKHHPPDPSPLSGVDSQSSKDSQRRDKSLGVMSQRFLILFLVSPTKVVSLDAAAKILISEPNAHTIQTSQFKTKIRRLYDIANVFTSLELIRKVHLREVKGRKPAFKYVGPCPAHDSGLSYEYGVSDVLLNRPSSKHSLLDRVASSSDPSDLTAGRGLTRHASFDQMCVAAERERAKLFPQAPLGLLSKDDTHAKCSPHTILPRYEQSVPAKQRHFILMPKGSKYELQAVDNTRSDMSMSKVIYMPRPASMDDSRMCDQDKATRNRGSHAHVSNPSVVFKLAPSHREAKIVRKGDQPRMVQVYEHRRQSVSRMLTPVSACDRVGRGVDAATQSSPQITHKTRVNPDESSLKSVNESTPILTTAGSADDTRVRKVVKRAVEQSGTESDSKRSGSDEKTGCRSTSSENADAEVETLSQRGVKRKAESDRRPSPLRALHLEPGFRQSPSLSSLPQVSQVRKDLSDDLDLATPLPLEDKNGKFSRAATERACGAFNCPSSDATTQASPSPIRNSVTDSISPTSECDAPVNTLTYPPFISHQSPSDVSHHTVTPIQFSPIVSKLCHPQVATRATPSRPDKLGIHTVYPLVTNSATANSKQFSAIKLIPQSCTRLSPPVNFMFQVPFSPPLTPTIEQNFTFSPSAHVSSSQFGSSPSSFPVLQSNFIGQNVPSSTVLLPQVLATNPNPV